jgi:hypothetical protein
MEPPHLAFGGIAQGLVLLHALVALALCGAATHHVVVAAGYLRGVYRVRLARIYAIVTASCYLAAFLLGLCAYPSYRYFVRGLYFDRHLVWASNLFDIKENYAALGVPFAVALLVLSRSFDPAKDKGLVAPYAVLVTCVCGLVWFLAISGLLITMQRGVPAGPSGAPSLTSPPLARC